MYNLPHPEHWEEATATKLPNLFIKHVSLHITIFIHTTQIVTHTARITENLSSFFPTENN